MDYARKIGKRKETALKTRSNICLNLQHPIPSSSSPLIEDNKLSNWKKWLADRKKLNETYTKILQRNENELLLNSGDKYRSIVETRELMEYASDPSTESFLTKNIDLNFWITPELLSNHGNPFLPQVEVPPSRKLNSIRKFEHVASPDFILEEKGLSKPSKLKHEYLEERYKNLAHVLSIIEPNPPKMEKLFVQGKNFKKRKSSFQKVPVITITSAEETERETNEWSIDPDAMIAALRIEDKEIVRRFNSKEDTLKNNGPYKLDLKFSSKVDEISKKEIVLENNGNMKIFFQWTSVCCDPKNFPSRQKEISAFFFNKNNDFILPGQILKFPVWFKSGNLGIKIEKWRFVTDPILCCEEIIFRFWGCCTEDLEMENTRRSQVQHIEKHLDNKIRNATIKEILEEILIDALTFQPPDPPYKDFFSEADIFTAKNPSYFYDSVLIKEFREIYNDISNSGPEWNLSILDLRNLLLEIEDFEMRERNLSRFVRTCKSALKPANSNSTRNEKYEKVYNLLCSFVNQFESESEFVKNVCFESRETEAESLVVKSGSNSLLKPSSGKIIPVSKKKPKKKSKKSPAENSTEEKKIRNKIEEKEIKKSLISKPSDIILYREIFFIRIYEILEETINKACCIIDSFIRLNEPEK